MDTNQRTYRARATSWALSTTKTGKEQVALGFEVQDPEAPEKAFTWYGYFTPDTFERTIEALRLCGWAGEDLSDLSGIERNEVNLVVEDEEYEGKVRARVRWVNSTGGVAVKNVMAPAAAKAFGAAMKDRIRAMGRPVATAAAPASSPSSAPTPPAGGSWSHPGAKKEPLMRVPTEPKGEDVPF